MENNGQAFNDYISLIERMKRFSTENAEVLSEIYGLSLGTLKRHLEKASKYQRGYYKNKRGEYIHVKGIEVTNNTGDLLRMGFNGEDRGVWVHYCIISPKSIAHKDDPISMFDYLFDKNWVSDDEVFIPTTKEDFERQFEETTKTILSDYTQKRDVQEYINAVDGMVGLFNEYEQYTEKTNLV